MKEITVREIIKSLEHERDWWKKELALVRSGGSLHSLSTADTKRIWIRKIIEIYDTNLENVCKLKRQMEDRLEDIETDEAAIFCEELLGE